ncbi:MAG: hypothetical protein AAGK78_04275, partial [Planctomycetota bacterium]
MPQTRSRTGRSHFRKLSASPLERLEQRRLLSAATADVVDATAVEAEEVRNQTRVTEYNVLTGEVQTLDYGQRINADDAGVLDSYLRDAGYNGLDDLLSTLGTPDQFLGTVERMLGNGGDVGNFERPGFNPS